MTEKGVAVVEAQLTREQIELVKHTVAIGATDNELALFLYQAKKRGLDPLTRQIYFIKRRQFNPDTDRYDEVGTIQTGIDGFRVIANRTGKLSGIKRGIILDEGNLIGAWAEVYRSDWQQPAREEVSLVEYCQTKKDGSPRGLWATMPETMLKKVAEAAALRMAFPEDLSGIYSHDEMAQADNEAQTTTITSPKPEQAKPSQDAVTAKEQAQKVGEDSPAIDIAWLKESLDKLKWQNVQVVSWLATKDIFKELDLKGRLTEVVARMSKEQVAALVAEIEDRLKMT